MEPHGSVMGRDPPACSTEKHPLTSNDRALVLTGPHPGAVARQMVTTWSSPGGQLNPRTRAPESVQSLRPPGLARQVLLRCVGVFASWVCAPHWLSHVATVSVANSPAAACADCRPITQHGHGRDGGMGYPRKTLARPVGLSPSSRSTVLAGIPPALLFRFT